MIKIGEYIYKIIFWLSRFFSISIFITSLFTVLNAKYVISEKYFYSLFNSSSSPNYSNSLFDFIFDKTDLFFTWFCRKTNIDLNIDIIGFNEHQSYSVFCSNSQSIDLLLISIILVLIISMLIIRYLNTEKKYLLVISTISFGIYISMYLIFNLYMMLALAISTPIFLAIILLLNKICPLQKQLMLIPIVGEIVCIKKILNYEFKNVSKNVIYIILLLTTLITSNIVCFLFLYKNFSNLIMHNWTYSIRPYEDKMIVSGYKELIIIDKDGNDYHIANDEFCFSESFVINKDKEEIYICNFDYDDGLLIVDMKTFDILRKIRTLNCDAPRICCNSDFSKLLLVNECKKINVLVDLSTYETKYIRCIRSRDGLIYNKFRNCFLVSFYIDNPFFQEIDIENKKTRKIKADKYQGYIAISEKNKEIYVAFHQQGRIGVYDAQTMKLKRKIKTNYTVKNITYDEELNILIAPSYFTGYVDIFLMDGSDKLLTREFIGYDLREGCFDSKKENLYVCSHYGLFKKKIDIKKLIEENSKNKKNLTKA